MEKYSTNLTSSNIEKCVFDEGKKTLILGLGQSGFSCVQYLANKKVDISVSDSRVSPPYLSKLLQHYAQIPFCHSEITEQLLNEYQQIIVSPGISIRQAVFEQAKTKGIVIMGDIDIFLAENQKTAQKPVIAVTGSNGKSTVVTLLEHIANSCGLNAIAGGNLGVPALDMLAQNADLYILELSSFQLETLNCNTTKTFISASALNVSPDHLDRYLDIDDYRQVKEKIYDLSDFIVVNKAEKTSHSLGGKKIRAFGLGKPNSNEYGLVKIDNSLMLFGYNKNEQTLNWGKANDLKINGLHNYLNVLAALALIEPLNLTKEKVQQALLTFTGLPHRCEWVDCVANKTFYNDSKGTNIGATIAAIEGFEQPLVLIAGGVGKKADFNVLAEVICHKVYSLILFGQDAKIIKDAVVSVVDKNGTENSNLLIESIVVVENLSQAVLEAYKRAKQASVILFSPACASFDQYENYKQRGEDFIQQVALLQARQAGNDDVFLTKKSTNY